MKKELLRLDWIAKSYDRQAVLKYINLDIFEGEVTAILGKNSVGKTTLFQIIAGDVQPDSGTIYLREDPIILADRSAAVANGIYYVDTPFQIVPDFDVCENVFLGMKKERGVLYHKKRVRKEVLNLIAQTGFSIDISLKGSRLSPVQCYMIHLLRAVSNRAKLVMMDEPFSAIDAREADELRACIRKLAQRNTAFLIASHDFVQISDLVEQFCILRDGTCAAVVENKGTGEDLFPRLFYNLLVDEPETEPVIRADGMGSPGKTIYEIQNLQTEYMPAPLSFTLGEHDVLGFAGFGDSIKNAAILDTLFGLRPMKNAVLLHHGSSLSISSPRQAILHKIAYLSDQDGQTETIPAVSMEKNITLPMLERLFPHSFPKPDVEHFVAMQYAEAFGISEEALAGNCRHLSQGMQKRVALLRWLSLSNELLLLNEPAKGLDLQSRTVVLKLIRQFAERGIPSVILSSRLDDLLSICNRVFVLNGGRICGRLEGNLLNQKNIFSMAFSHQPEQEEAQHV